MTIEPTRLLDDAAAPADLRRDLAALARQRVPYDVAAGAARLEAKLAQGAGSAGAWSGGKAIGLGALLLGGAVAAALLWPSPGPRPAEPAVVALAAPAATPEPPPAPVVATPPAAPRRPDTETIEVPEAPEEPAAKPTPEPPRLPKARVRKAAPEQEAPSAPPPETDTLREARSLQAARALLGRDPAGALARAEAGAREFVGGTFAQEWEGVAILALFELERPEAKARAREFLVRYPKGPYSVQVREASER